MAPAPGVALRHSWDVVIPSDAAFMFLFQNPTMFKTLCL